MIKHRSEIAHCRTSYGDVRLPPNSNRIAAMPACPKSANFGSSPFEIGIGGSLAAPPLPHHRTYGSVYGGSLDYAAAGFARKQRPSDPKKRIGMAMLRAGLLPSRQGPRGLPAVCAARSRPTPRRRSSGCTSALPLFPGDGAQPPPEPFVKCSQHRRRLAEAEVAAPPGEVSADRPIVLCGLGL